jgi:xanthine dehydrogenase accessory factor
MIVTRELTRHTVGGGHLEWRGIEIAREMLRDHTHVPHLRRLERFALGPTLGQCCGGSVVLAFERLDVSDLGWVATLAKRMSARQATVRSVSFGAAADAVRLADDVALGVAGALGKAGALAPLCVLEDSRDAGEALTLLTETIALREFDVVLFGAGHVGAALVPVLATLPCRVRWVDERDTQFPARCSTFANVTIDANDAPDEAVDEAAPGTSFIVMTHNHARDLVLAERILRRADFLFFGMIGSHTKRSQFEHRLAARGIDPLAIARMRCPIGIEGIADKAPEVIAVATAAQLLQAVEAARANATLRSPQETIFKPQTTNES